MKPVLKIMKHTFSLLTAQHSWFRPPGWEVAVAIRFQPRYFRKMFRSRGIFAPLFFFIFVLAAAWKAPAQTPASTGGPAKTTGSSTRVEDPSFGQPAKNFDRLDFPKFDVSLPARLTQPSEEEKAKQREAGTRLLAEISAAATEGKGSLTVPPGLYRFTKDQIPLSLTGVTGFSLDAKGAEWILEGTQPAVRLERCRDITLRGVTVERDPFPYTQFEVVSFDPAAKKLEARFLEGYDPQYVPDPKGDLQFFTRDGVGVRQVFIHYTSFRVTDPAQRLMVFEGVETYEPAPWMQPGVLGVTTLRGGFHCIRTIECGGITVEDFTNHGGMQIIFGELGDGDFTFRRIRNLGRPGTNRLLAGAFGLMTWVRGHMVLEDSIFCRSNDDALDMVSWNSIVYRQESPTQIIARPMCDTPYRVGDTLQFHDRMTFSLVGSPKITAVEKIADPAMSADAAAVARKVAGYIGGLHEFSCVRITLDAPVTVKPGDTIANDTSFRLDSFTLKNCLFYDIFCRVLVHGLKAGLIEGNVILRSGLAAICVDNEQQNWAEGPDSRNVVIRGNVIQDSPYSPYMNFGHQLSGAISVGFQQYQKEDAVPNTGQTSRNITIEDNRILNPMYAGILVKNTDGLRIVNNVIENPVTKAGTVRKETDPGQKDYYGVPQDAAIFLYACRNVTVQGNNIKNRGPYCRREVAQIPGFAREKIGVALTVRRPAAPWRDRPELTLDWQVTEPPKTDGNIFLQVVDDQGVVLWETEEAARPAASAWKPGKVSTGPYIVRFSASTNGTFNILGGFVSPQGRAELAGTDDGERRYFLGRLKVSSSRTEFLPPQPDIGLLGLKPSLKSIEPVSPNQFRAFYGWEILQKLQENWTVLVHFTEVNGKGEFNGDHLPTPPTSAWRKGASLVLPQLVRVPPGATGIYDIHTGLYKKREGGQLEVAQIEGPSDERRRILIGRVKLTDGKAELLPLP